jgi:hypothetical protein
MLIRSVIRKSIEPLLNKNGFHFGAGENDIYVFQHEKNNKLKILFTFRYMNKSVGCHLQRGSKNDLLSNYPLSMFLDGISPMKVSKNDGFWFYRSDEELGNVLEEHGELLTRFGFDWLFDCLELKIEEC